MSRLVVADTLTEARHLGYRPHELVVTPRTLERVRGCVVHDVTFTPLAVERMPAAERELVAEAILPATMTSPRGDEIRAQLARWVVAA